MAVRKAGADPLFLGALALAVAIFAIASFDAVVETDAGFHVAIGRLVLHSGIPRTNALSWIARDQPWYPNAWLFDAAAAALHDRLGPLGLQLLTFALGLCALLLTNLLLRFYDPAGPLLLPAIALLLEGRLRPRPHVASWVCIAAVLLLCLTGRRRLRWACLPLLILFGNLHAGAAFAAGIAGLFFLEAAWKERSWRELSGAALAGLALLVNPGGLYNLWYFAAHLGVQEVVPLREFGLPRWPGSALFVLAAAGCLVPCWRRRREQPALSAAVFCFALLGTFTVRTQNEFFLVAAPWLGELPALIEHKLAARAARLFAALALLLAALQMSYGQRLAALDLGPRFDSATLPVRAARYVADKGLTGPHFNSFDDGGYLAAALPAVPVFIDGRVQAYPNALWQRLIAAQRSPAAFDGMLRETGSEWALVLRREAFFTGNGLLDAQPGWALVYWDGLSEIFVRRDVQRWAPLIASDELHFLWPSGIHAGPADRVRAEADRLLIYSPDDPLLLSARALAGR